ncbi:hypothetical protein K2Z83_02200 [Oscillochloris sp. ZM17-4]|uniref:hypothetical protein n=1 Tax=Oscillochloris sp. ZM17-4 TaxID=2866714 RepID=UPI001C72AC33|nr:hypothetical protein [Oscillochloris sp. ZM17-4]MBX0326505.1 hypothetical protein [Oscillochloris sp. ZM17-4]
MNDRAVHLKLNLRVWQDERMGQLWRLAYRDGDDDETVITFPDSAALGDFIADRLGLNLIDTPRPPMAVEAA